MGKFNFNNMAKNVGSVGEEMRKVESKKYHDFRIIPIEELHPNDKNDYPMESIEQLMKRIFKFGLIHNLNVKPVEKGFDIISGERRYRAIKHGLEIKHEGHEQFLLGIPCMVTDKDVTNVTEEIKLIIANEEVRDEDPARKMRKVARLTELINQLNEETGNTESVTKQVAQELGLDERTVQRYNSIDKKLIPELQRAFEESKITMTDASKFAAMDEAAQLVIAELINEKETITKTEIEAIRKTAKEEAKRLTEESNKKAQEEIKKAEKVLKENEELQKKIEAAEAELKRKEELEEKLRKEIKEESKSENPDKEKIRGLEDELEKAQRISSDKEKEYKETQKLLKQRELENKKLTEKIKNEEESKNSIHTLSPEEKERLKSDFDITVTMEEVIKHLSRLSTQGKKHKDKFGEIPQDLNEFSEKIKKSLNELLGFVG